MSATSGATTPTRLREYAERRRLVESLDTDLLQDMLDHETDPATVGLLTLVLRLRARREQGAQA